MTETAWHVVEVGARDFYARVDDVGALKATALGDPHGPAERAAFRGILARHVARPGFRARACFGDGEPAAGELLGMAYGYRGGTGDWWHDVVAGSLDRATAAAWLEDAFEVVELHVQPASQGRGLGTALLASLLAGVSRPTAVLSTRTTSTGARAFYAARGWVTLRSALRFTQGGAPYEILGHRLPLEG